MAVFRVERNKGYTVMIDTFGETYPAPETI